MRIQKAAIMGAVLSASIAMGVGQQAQAAGLTKVTISYAQKTVDFMTLLLAQDAGYFKKYGIDATVRYLPAQQGIPAMLTGQVQFAGIGGADAISAQAQGAKLKLVATITGIYPFQFWSRPEYKTAESLKGKRVGITSTTGSLYAGTLLALKQLDLKTTDVAMTPLGGVVNVNNSLLAGSIAAAASHPPATYKFEQAGLNKLVDLAEKRLPAVSAGVWVTDAYNKAHPKTVQAVVNAVRDALQREVTDRAFTEKEMTKYLKVTDKGQLDFTYNFYAKDVFSLGPIPQAPQLQGNVDAMVAGNPKLKTIDINEMIDQSYAKKAK